MTRRLAVLALLLASGPLVAPAQMDDMTGSWSATGSMKDGRFEHQGVRLQDAGDRWLVAGGRSFAGGNVYDVDSAELFDPARGTWKPTRSLGVARYGYALVRLADGRAMAIGGGSSAGALASTEIYDPAAGDEGLWSPGPSLNYARSAFQAVALADGRVYAFGGTLSRTVEVYEPDPGAPGQNRWRVLSPLMAAPRFSFTATPFGDGLILLAGGETRDYPNQVLASAEVFDPATESFPVGLQPASDMLVARMMHGAVKLDGGKLLLVAGMSLAMTHLACDFYDPTTRLFSAAAPLGMRRSNHSVDYCCSGKVLIAGGYMMGAMDGSSTSEAMAGSERYDPDANSWSMAGAMADRRTQHVSTAYCGTPCNGLVVAGGRVDMLGTPANNRCEEYLMSSALAAPALVSPADAASVATRAVSLDWADLAGAASYQAQVAASADVREPLEWSDSVTASQATTAELADDRTYYWRVRGLEADGRRGRWSAVRSFAVNAPPETQILSGPASPTRSTSASFSFGASEPASYEYSLDGGAWTPSADSLTITVGEGNHVLEARATDSRGNADSSPASWSWTVDITAPDSQVVSGPPDPTASTSASFAFSASEPGSTFEYSLDGGAWTATGSSLSLTVSANATHTLRVRATDPAGNSDASPAQRTWRVDTQAPGTPALLSPSSGATVNVRSVPLDWSNVSDFTGVTYHLQVRDANGAIKVDRQGLVPSNDTTSPLDRGKTYYWKVRARDGAGNWGSWSAERSFKVHRNAQ